MKLLLDAHVLLWWLADDPKLSPVHRELISNGKNTAWVSSVTVAEISIKVSLGKLEFPGDVNPVVEENGFAFAPFTEQHAAALRELPFHHRDPFDRMLIAQAQVDRLTLLTVDPNIQLYDIRTQ